MLDDVAGMRDDAGAEHFAFGQLHPLEQVVLVLVPRVRSLEADGAGIDLQDILDDLGQIYSWMRGPSLMP